MQIKEAVEIWKTNRQQRNEEAKKRKAGRVQNNDPAALENLGNVPQRSRTSSSGAANRTNNVVTSGEPKAKKMMLDVDMDD